MSVDKLQITSVDRENSVTHCKQIIEQISYFFDGTGQKLRRPSGHLDGGRPGSDPAVRLVRKRLPGYQGFTKKDDQWPFAISAAYVHSSYYLKIGKKSTAAHLSKVPLFCVLSSSRLIHKVSKVISSRIFEEGGEGDERYQGGTNRC